VITLPRTKITKTKTKTTRTVNFEEPSLMQKIQNELQLDQSYLSLVLGLLIVLIAGILVFNYFKGAKPDLGPAQQTEEVTADVAPENLPGSYTVKDGDTLFTIAEKYYQDGYKYPEIASKNNIINVDSIAAGQVLEIPKLETTATVATSDATISETPSEPAIGGAENQTIWGEKITSDKYTVVAGDWLSKIAGRAYGDPMTYAKIAEANNITTPDWIEIGTVLTIPR
jgi:nucleoid-associated protein YgaU